MVAPWETVAVPVKVPSLPDRGTGLAKISEEAVPLPPVQPVAVMAICCPGVAVPGLGLTLAADAVPPAATTVVAARAAARSKHIAVMWVVLALYGSFTGRFGR
ncbi:hypothetical protein [Streptomyces sp. NPDC047028]|uniref:hypothetical protein n=1 Tax=Streptomyces sp. NPDC047028 TaxID=3155793 RepID=UPI0034039799